jgi:hypothetical protein
MTDPKQVRLNDGEDPDRAEKFHRAIVRTAANGNQILRHLIDGYLRYVEKHGHGPAFPIEIIEKAGRKRRR